MAIPSGVNLVLSWPGARKRRRRLTCDPTDPLVPTQGSCSQVENVNSVNLHDGNAAWTMFFQGVPPKSSKLTLLRALQSKINNRKWRNNASCTHSPNQDHCRICQGRCNHVAQSSFNQSHKAQSTGKNCQHSFSFCSKIMSRTSSHAKPRPWRFPRRIPRRGSPCKNHVLPPNCLKSNELVMLLLMGVAIEVNLALVNWHSPILPEARIFCRHTGDQWRIRVSTTHFACIVPMPKKNTKVHLAVHESPRLSKEWLERHLLWTFKRLTIAVLK